MFGILLACLMLVVAPIIAVQYPRYCAFTRDYKPDAERQAADTGLDGAGETMAAGDEIQGAGRVATSSAFDMKGMGMGRKPWDRPEPDEIKAAGRAAMVGVRGEEGMGKKPWDPPFPLSPKSGREMYRVLGRSPSPAVNEKGKGRERIETVEDEMENIFEPMGGHIPVTEPLNDPLPISPPNYRAPPAREPSRNATFLEPKSDPAPAPAAKDPCSRSSLLQTIALVLAFIIFIFAFAILTAHCLA